jgi:hypothetical protein
VYVAPIAALEAGGHKFKRTKGHLFLWQENHTGYGSEKAGTGKHTGHACALVRSLWACIEKDRYCSRRVEVEVRTVNFHDKAQLGVMSSAKS